MNKAIYDPAYRALVAKLRDTRRRQGLRQVDVARRLEVNRSWLSKVESCEVRLDVGQLIHVARVYGLHAYKLVRQAEEGLSG